MECIHQASLTILEEIGLDFWDAETLSLWARAGARVDFAAQHVWINRSLADRLPYDSWVENGSEDTVQRAHRLWRAALAAYTPPPDRFPVWIWMDEPCFYGFPLYGEPAVKVAQDVGGREVTAHTRTFDPDPDILQRTEQFVARCLPTALGPVHYSKTCLYTMTPDRDFVIDTVPGHPNNAVGLGAAHGFKFASVIGRLLAGLAGHGPVDVDLSPFAMDCAILLEQNPARSFLI